ncbi:MAG TPA: LytTR family DNA-binding domain-containing protein [Prolixibacteraceae bacterium]|nr:LytTR family DNA-binding domain-containing protein [Prolixibacteraceae bacterium]
MIVCIAVDDEPKALEVLSIHAAKAPEIDLVRTFTNPMDALAFLKDNFVDLILLDINMPGISGLQLAEKLQSKPYIIFTTAYSEYAIESYDFEAVDYLLKPIEFDRFYKAINKVKRQIQLNGIQQDSLLSKFIFIKDGYKQIKICIDDILYIQSEGNYLNIVTEKEKVLARMTFQYLLEKLPRNLFFRIHNSYVINLSHIQKIEDNHIFMQDVKIPIGIKYKDQFLSFLNLA